MSKAKQKKKVSHAQRKKMIDEVFKRGKKQREIAKKFDAKIASKQGGIKKHKIYKVQKKVEKQGNRDHIAELDKKLNSLRADGKF